MNLSLIPSETAEKQPRGYGGFLRKHPDYIAPHTAYRQITVESVRVGQPRPYADGIYESLMLFEGGHPSTEADFDLSFACRYQEAEVKKLAKVLVHNFVDEPTHALEPHLQSIKMEAEGEAWQLWRVIIISPFTD